MRAKARAKRRKKKVISTRISKNEYRVFDKRLFAERIGEQMEEEEIFYTEERANGAQEAQSSEVVENKGENVAMDTATEQVEEEMDSD